MNKMLQSIVLVGALLLCNNHLKTILIEHDSEHEYIVYHVQSKGGATDTDVVQTGRCLFYLYEIGVTEVVLNGNGVSVQDTIEMMNY